MDSQTRSERTGPLYLASSDCPGLAEWLAMHRHSGPAVVITAASAGLPDQAGIVEPLVAASMAAGAGTLVLDLQADPRPALEITGALVLPGGDPFRLLRELRASGAAAVIARRHAAGLPVAGQSAGAMVCAPTLVPLTLTSPFTPAPGQDLEGLGLTPTVVLPHHDAPGRADRHRAAARRHAGAGLVPLWDGEARLESSEGWEIREGDRITRPARVADASAVAAVFRAATTAAWSAFLGAARLRDAPDDTPLWAGRIEAGGEGFLVTEDAHGLLGFVCWRAASEDAAQLQPVGEVDLLYTLPRAWGLGIGRRLLERATFALLAAGCREAVLWTEARNGRALAVYQRNGWVRDGAFIDREYLGVPIRNLRHRLDLGAWAGGGRRSD